MINRKLYTVPAKWARKRTPRLAKEVGPLESALQSAASQELHKDHPDYKKTAMIHGFFDEFEQIQRVSELPLAVRRS